MTNTKMNGAPLQKSLGVRFVHGDFESSTYAIAVEQFDPLAQSALSSNLRLGDRIIAELRVEPRTEKDLIDATGAARTSVRRCLDRLERMNQILRDGGSKGPGNMALYRVLGTSLGASTTNGHVGSNGRDVLPF